MGTVVITGASLPRKLTRNGPVLVGLEARNRAGKSDRAQSRRLVSMPRRFTHVRQTCPPNSRLPCSLRRSPSFPSRDRPPRAAFRRPRPICGPTRRSIACAGSRGPRFDQHRPVARPCPERRHVRRQVHRARPRSERALPAHARPSPRPAVTGDPHAPRRRLRKSGLHLTWRPRASAQAYPRPSRAAPTRHLVAPGNKPTRPAVLSGASQGAAAAPAHHTDFTSTRGHHDGREPSPPRRVP